MNTTFVLVVLIISEVNDLKLHVTFTHQLCGVKRSLLSSSSSLLYIVSDDDISVGFRPLRALLTIR